MARETLVGTSVAGYTIDREVGEGGTSSVYDAHHPVHGRVALKILRERLRQDATAIARFEREAQLGKRVSHPNVVRTIETGVATDVPGVTGGLPFLAIEWADGEILEKYVKQGGVLARDEVATIVMQLAAAVDALHRENIVHRDLKPENVIYDPQTRCAKLLDFGIAAETNTPNEERLTRVGFFVGTLMYVSPESLSGGIMRPRRAFTLIELLIVVVIIGILAAIAIPKFSYTKNNAYVGRLKSDLRNFASAQEGYFYENGTYSATVAALAPAFVPSTGTTITVVTANAAGWSATATSSSTSAVCALFYGVAAVAPATADGIISCQ